jgi:outer membrane immunogenic protein
MRRLSAAFIAGVSAVAFAQIASATDLPLKAKPIVTGYSWTGFYAGVNGGYGVGRGPSGLTNFLNPPPGTLQIADSWYFDPAGALGGVQAGYNYQIDHWVIGVEADIQATDQKDSVCRLCTAAIGYTNVEQKIPWFGTMRGRIGWAAGPIFSYFTGGWAYGQIQTDLSLSAVGFPTTSGAAHETKSGWTIGTGVEAALAGNWTAKVEYLYMSLGSTEVPFTNSGSGFSRTMVTSDIRDRIIRVGLNYRFGSISGSGSATSPTPTFRNWAGFYAGGNGGYGVARDPSVLAINVALGNFTNDQWNESPGGYFGGVQFGYGWQTAQFVYGLEADIQGGNLKDSACLAICGLPTSFNEVVDQKITWFGTVRGRAGYAAGPALFYVTGGLAYGNVKTTLTETVPALAFTATASTSSTNAGWTIGGGAEIAMWGNWTAKTEYLYMDLGSTSLSMTSIVPGGGPLNPVTHALNSDVRAHIFRGGLNYHF